MRRILTSVVLLVFLFPSFALGLEMDDLVERGGLYYEKFTDVPFSGKIEGLQRGSFKDGKKDGPWVAYYDNGQIQYKGTFKDGEEDGFWIGYYVNGQLWSKGTYKDGEEDGLWVTYLADRTVWEEYTGTFKNGVKVD